MCLGSQEASTMRLLHRLFFSPPPWLTLLVGIVLGGVLTSTFTFRLWWCSYSDLRYEREAMRLVPFRERVPDLTNLALTNGIKPHLSLASDKCVCGAELKRLQDSLPPVSRAAILEPSVRPSINILTNPDKEDQFVPLRLKRTANETQISNYLHPKSKMLNESKESVQYLSHEFHMRKQLFVAVVTSGNHLESASTVYDTWGVEANQVVFFVGKDCNASNPHLRGLPLVRLPNIPDLPMNSVAKSFSVIKYINDNYLNDFQWFLLVSDNVYVRTTRLGSLLKQLDPAEEIYLGRAARGKEDDLKKLSLLPHERYCLGSSGVVLSHGLLQAVSPKLEFCLNALLSGQGGQGTSNHADVELGRCISRHVGVQCSQATQVC